MNTRRRELPTPLTPLINYRRWYAGLITFSLRKPSVASAPATCDRNSAYVRLSPIHETLCHLAIASLSLAMRI